jgi:hypothetical protein
LWVPYPGGHFQVTAFIHGNISKCCKENQYGYIADVTVGVEGKATIGVGAGGNRGLKTSSTSPSGLRKSAGQAGGGQFAKNPGKGWNKPSAMAGRSSNPLPLCEDTFFGSFTLEIGAKAGAIGSCKVFLRNTFLANEPININYGIEMSVDFYIGAELYFLARGEGTGVIVLY